MGFRLGGRRKNARLPLKAVVLNTVLRCRAQGDLWVYCFRCFYVCLSEVVWFLFCLYLAWKILLVQVFGHTMESWKIFVFHGITFMVYIFALTYDTFYLASSPTKQSYAGRFKFLTFWNEVGKT